MPVLKPKCATLKTLPTSYRTRRENERRKERKGGLFHLQAAVNLDSANLNTLSQDGILSLTCHTTSFPVVDQFADCGD